MYKKSRSALTNCAPVSDRGRKMYRKSESVETTTAHARNLYWTSTFFAFFMARDSPADNQIKRRELLLLQDYPKRDYKSINSFAKRG